MLVCESTAHPSVFNFTWFKNNVTITEVSAAKRDQQAAYMETSYDPEQTPTGDSDNHSAVSGGATQSAVLVLVDGDFDAYSCIAANAIGASRPCKLADTQIAGKFFSQVTLNLDQS